MAERVYLHIGAPKTGTTYLQQALAVNRKRMKGAGVLYPRVTGDAHHSAVWDLREMWEQRENAVNLHGEWDKAVRKVLAWDGPTALLSSELFVYADERQAAKALASFGNIQVHVVYTARDLVRQVPAVWQERLKNQRTMGYEQFVTDVIGPAKSGMAKGFWNAQDAPTALKRWSQGLPPSQVHVVTMPPSGSSPDLLWDRFMSVVGLDGPEFRVDVPAVNTSMGAVEAEVLRRLNQRHAQDIGPVTYRKIVRDGLFDVLHEAVPNTFKITLTAAEHNALVKRAEVLATGLSSAGYDIVGDLTDLVPAPADSSSAAAVRRPAGVTEAEVTDALLDVVYGLLDDRRKRVESTRKRSRRKKRATGPAGDDDSRGANR